jgi:AcrR family transcriptional regulator
MGQPARQLPVKRSNNRNDALLDAAARLFASRGYRETTMRDIAAVTGMLPGSIYYHYGSKAELLLAVYEKGVDGLCDRFDGVVAGAETSWDRLEAVLVAHFETILDQSDYARVLIRVLPDHLPEIAPALSRLRDTYEDRIAAAIDALPLDRSVDPKMLRLLLLGAANWSQTWYRPGADSPSNIARQFLSIVRRPLETSDD